MNQSTKDVGGYICILGTYSAAVIWGTHQVYNTKSIVVVGGPASFLNNDKYLSFPERKIVKPLTLRHSKIDRKLSGWPSKAFLLYEAEEPRGLALLTKPTRG